MGDPTDLDTNHETTSGREQPTTSGPPRWVKLSLIVTAVVIVGLFLVLMVVRGPGGGGHGPVRHAPAAKVQQQ